MDPGQTDHDSYSDSYLSNILKSSRVFAVVGASARPIRPSYGVMQFLLSRGFSVIPINPGEAGGEIHGQRVFASLSEVPGPVDVVDIFRASDAVPAVVAEALAQRERLLIKTIWMQLGVRNEEAARSAEDAGLHVVMDRCPVIEIRRLGL